MPPAKSRIPRKSRKSQIFASNGKPPLVFRYENDTDFLPILERLKAIGCDSITFIGYYPRLLEFAGKLAAVKDYRPAILLSDGCYSSDLASSSWAKEFSLSFPVPPRHLSPISENGNSKPDKGWLSAGGVGLLAGDAASMIVMTANENAWRLNDRGGMLEAFARLNHSGFGPPEVSQRYRFVLEKSESSDVKAAPGDNLKAEFWIYQFDEDDPQ